MKKNRVTQTVAMAMVLTAVGASVPEPVEAHPRGGRRGPVIVVRRGFGSHFGFGSYFGPYGPYAYGPYSYGPYSYGPYAYGPYAYGPVGGVDLNVAMMAGYGGVEMNVKPGQAEVWVDGKFIAEAKDLDGYPSYLWLKEGVHKIVVYKGGYERFEEEIDVQRGFKKDLRVRLEKGESDAPGRRPAGQV